MPDGREAVGGPGPDGPEQRDPSRARLAGAIALLLIILVAVALLLWPRPVTVPDVVGMSRSDATKTILTAGFSVGAVATRTAETTPDETVLDQDPRGGTSAAVGSAVAFTVSVAATSPAGPPLSSLAAPDSDVQIPGVVGQPQALAVTALTEAGFAVSTSTSPGGQPAGSVLVQFPSGGVMAPAGSTVEITVSTGLTAAGIAVATGPGGRVVPDILGKTRAAASRTLSGAGFSMSVLYAPSTTTASGLVFYQTPQSGASGGNPTRVTAWVSTGTPHKGRPYPIPAEEK